MSWHCSQALVAAFSEVTCSECAPSARSNTTPMPETYYWPDKTTEHSRLSRFGMTSAPLTADRGEELLTSYLAAFPARISASPATATASMECEAGSGWKCEGSFVKYDPGASTWRTRQCSLLGGLEEFSETWPNWGSMRDGECLEHTTPTLPTSDRGSGFWPTPVASMAKGSSPASLTRKNGRDRSKDRLDHAIMASDGGPLNPQWVEWLMGWPIGWTDLKPLETVKFREWQQQHSICSAPDGSISEPQLRE